MKIKLIDGKFVELEKGSKEPGSFYIDGILKRNLDRVKQLIRDDWDYVYVIDGEVGSGKSVFAQQLAHFASDGRLKIEHITFDPKEFRDVVLKAEKYTAIVMDEAFRGMSSRGSLSKTNKMLMDLMQEIRQKNLFIFIVLPSIWDLDKHISLFRCKGIFHVYTGENRERGYWKYFKNKEDAKNRNQLVEFLGDHKNRYKYPYRSSMRGRFLNYHPINETEYKNKKSKALGSSTPGESIEDKNTLRAD